MWSNHDNNFAAKGFSTPPACWKSPHALPVMPMSERKSNFPSGCRRDLFHVVHKVPAGDSPYVRAKHVQLIDKDPSKAISLFWAAINAGDRVDSALKDMAVVMKQLNRSDEAIEAIKSFRHLCPFESQESLDNVLVELYKRSGRIEEEIEMLHCKLKNIEEGIAFGGKRTKIARSQGKKIQITVEQERSRILGNLAWAYLQHHDYGLAENFYRKALALEPDNNKQCNLAICLMHINRIPEAKSLLQAVKGSCGSKEMDESYAKSFERAVEMLTEMELKSTGDDDWRKLNNSKCLSSGMNHAGVLYTQPRKVSWRFGAGDDETRGRCNEDEIKIPFHTIRNLDGELLHSKSDCAASRNVVSPGERSWTSVVEPFSQARQTSCGEATEKKSWADMVEEDEERRLLAGGEDVSPCLNNENIDWNMDHQSPSQKLEASRNQSVRRSLCFDLNMKKKNRLQVFRDITPSQDSP
ncbi:protein POLLENLESS 3 [Euphorbia lathyris]|uniref:protein POLLENLESS 3 n=1 Tax=Euphorbia lathyris TaxID=212925 RepID=UPI0033142B41